MAQNRRFEVTIDGVMIEVTAKNAIDGVGQLIESGRLSENIVYNIMWRELDPEPYDPSNDPDKPKRINVTSGFDGLPPTIYREGAGTVILEAMPDGSVRWREPIIPMGRR